MFRSWKIGSLFGIPVYVHSTFLLAPLLTLYLNRGASIPAALFLVALVVATFGCVLLHEFGHALMARYFGIKTRSITLYPIGGVARLERMSEEPHEEILIAVAGPAVNVAIAALLTPVVLYAILTGIVSADSILELSLGGSFWTMAVLFALGLWFMNIILVLFNLIPAFPMDGGRVLRGLLSMGLGFPRATEIAARVGTVMAFGMGLFGIFVLKDYMLPFLALFVAVVGQGELLAVRQRERARQAQERLSYLQPFEEPPAGRRVEVVVPPPRPSADPQLMYRFRAIEIPEPPH